MLQDPEAEEAKAETKEGVFDRTSEDSEDTGALLLSWTVLVKSAKAEYGYAELSRRVGDGS